MFEARHREAGIAALVVATAIALSGCTINFGNPDGELAEYLGVHVQAIYDLRA